MLAAHSLNAVPAQRGRAAVGEWVEASGAGEGSLPDSETSRPGREDGIGGMGWGRIARACEDGWGPCNRVGYEGQAAPVVLKTALLLACRGCLCIPGGIKVAATIARRPPCKELPAAHALPGRRLHGPVMDRPALLPLQRICHLARKTPPFTRTTHVGMPRVPSPRPRWAAPSSAVDSTGRRERHRPRHRDAAAVRRHVGVRDTAGAGRLRRGAAARQSRCGIARRHTRRQSSGRTR